LLSQQGIDNVMIRLSKKEEVKCQTKIMNLAQLIPIFSEDALQLPRSVHHFKRILPLLDSLSTSIQ